MLDDPNRAHLVKSANYERVSRTVRWLTIALALVTFPIDNLRAAWVYGIVVVASVYNLSRYSTRLLNHWLWRSNIASLVLDTILVSSFIYITGGLSTPYTMFYVLIIAGAVYQEGFKGALLVIALQSGLLAYMSSQPYQPLSLSPVRAMMISIASLCTLGFFLDQLTRHERHERDALIGLEGQMRSESERLLVLINSLTEATFLIDQQGKILLYSASALSLLSTDLDIHHQDLPKLLQLADAQGKPVDLLELASQGSKLQRNDLMSHATPGSGMLLALSVAPVPINLANKAAINYVVICRDITKEKTLDQQRDEFISVASHELRTPLTIAEAALSMALRPEMKASSEVVTRIKQAYRNVIFLSELVRDLTTLSDAQNNTITIQLKPLDPKAFIDQLAKDYRDEIRNKGLLLKVYVKPKTPSILTTEHYVREIMQNYLVNAIKYTDKGEINLRIEPIESGKVQFSVQDTGIGVSASDQKHLFTKFYRSEDYRTRKTSGTGLGLYLCSQLAERLNAKVWCASVINKGSTFYLEVPPYSQLKEDRRDVVKAQMSTLVEEL